MSVDSWQVFADALGEENRLLGELGSAALAMTDALIGGTPADVESTERRVEAARVLHAHANAHRVTMMSRGFGRLGLAQVCAYAPGPVRRRVFASLHELMTGGIALRITVNNNKSLILAGMERLTKTIDLLQERMTEQPGTYKRRGTVPRSNGSVIVSRKA